MTPALQFWWPLSPSSSLSPWSVLRSWAPSSLRTAASSWVQQGGCAGLPWLPSFFLVLPSWLPATWFPHPYSAPLVACYYAAVWPLNCQPFIWMPVVPASRPSCWPSLWGPRPALWKRYIALKLKALAGCLQNFNRFWAFTLIFRNGIISIWIPCRNNTWRKIKYYFLILEAEFYTDFLTFHLVKELLKAFSWLK